MAESPAYWEQEDIPWIYGDALVPCRKPLPLPPTGAMEHFATFPDSYIYTDIDNEPLNDGGWLKFFLSRKEDRYPPRTVESVRSDLKSLSDGEFVWLGHSSFLLRLAGKTICIDPVLADRASPVPFTVPAWPGTNIYAASDFPAIDYLCITHDHWDHLDYKAATSLEYGKALCGKGVGAHFRRWGLKPPEELDWGDSSKSFRVDTSAFRRRRKRGLLAVSRLVIKICITRYAVAPINYAMAILSLA